MPEEPIAVNVFARLHDAHTFLAVCRRTSMEGAKTPRFWAPCLDTWHGAPDMEPRAA